MCAKDFDSDVRVGPVCNDQRLRCWEWDGRVRFLLTGLGTVMNERGLVLQAGVHESGVVAFVELL